MRAALPPERYGAVIHIIPRVAEAIFVVRNAGVPPGEQLATIASLRPPQPGQARAVTLKYGTLYIRSMDVLTNHIDW